MSIGAAEERIVFEAAVGTVVIVVVVAIRVRLPRDQRRCHINRRTCRAKCTTDTDTAATATVPQRLRQFVRIDNCLFLVQ